MSIYKNAISSIQIGVQDYATEEKNRELSAIRNITSGILLLYKHKLIELSPDYDKEALIKKKLLPEFDKNGKIIFVGHGKKTVDTVEIKERFKSLEIKVDWKRFQEINELRNNIEHYYSNHSEGRIKEIISKSFILIRDFISIHLKDDPSEVLGMECWKIFVQTTDLYEKEKEDCESALRKITWKHGSLRKIKDFVRCPECLSELITVAIELDSEPQGAEISFQCKYCNEVFDFEDNLENAISEAFFAESHIAGKEGGDLLYDLCPQCSNKTYIIEDDICVFCDYKREYFECVVCYSPLGLEEQDYDGICAYHYFQAKKDD